MSRSSYSKCTRALTFQNVGQGQTPLDIATAEVDKEEWEVWCDTYMCGCDTCKSGRYGVTHICVAVTHVRAGGMV